MEWKGRKTEEDTGNLSSKLGHIVSAIMNNSVSKVSRVYSETTLYFWNVFWDSTYPEPIVSSFLCFLTSFLSFTFQRLSYLFLLLSFSHVRLFVAPWTAHQDSMSSTISQSLLKLMTSKSIIPSNHLILHCPLLLLPSIFPSIRVFSNESALCIRWSKYWNFASTSVLPMNIQEWFPLGLTGWISLQSKGLSRVFSGTPVWKHQSFRAQSYLWSNSHICRWLLVKPLPRLYGPLLAKWCLCFLICCLGCPIL